MLDGPREQNAGHSQGQGIAGGRKDLKRNPQAKPLTSIFRTDRGLTVPGRNPCNCQQPSDPENIARVTVSHQAPGPVGQEGGDTSEKSAQTRCLLTAEQDGGRKQETGWGRAHHIGKV
ncbi:hypothetical protein GN956_G19867 [Arapaima gigas]